MRRSIPLLAVVCLGLVPGPASAACGSSGYAYAGIANAKAARGVAANVRLESASRVAAGHVAAWIGLGGRGLGPGGSDAWIQTGIVTYPGSAARLYVESKRPRHGRRYREIGPPARVGVDHRLVIVELASRPGRWQVWIDGRPVGRGIQLPGSHGRFPPIATAESWDGGSQACNGYRFRFDDLAVLTQTGRWEKPKRSYVLADPGQELVRLGLGSFLARSRR